MSQPTRIWTPEFTVLTGTPEIRASTAPGMDYVVEYLRANRVEDMIEAGVGMSILLVLAHYSHLDAKNIATCIKDPCVIQRALTAWAEAAKP